MSHDWPGARGTKGVSHLDHRMELYGLNRLLRRAGLYAPLHRLAHGAQMALGRSAGDATSPEFVTRLERALAGLPDMALRAERRLLVAGWSSISAAAQQIPILGAFICAGFAPIVILESKSTPSRKLYAAAGATDFAYWNELQPSRTMADDLTPVSSQDDLLALENDGLRIGRYALSTMMRSTRCGRFDFTDPVVKAAAMNWLQKALDAAAFADQLVRRWKPDALLVTDQGYIPLGPLFERCVNAGTPSFTWNAGHRDNIIMLKRYGPDNIDSHFASLSAKSWETVRRRPWSQADWNALAAELAHCYRSGQWFGEVGTQFHKVFPARDELMRRLSLDPGRRTVLLFPHIFWDGTFFWGHDLFPDYEAFFTEALRVAYETPSANWIAKIHPANVVKNHRDGFSGRSNEMRVIDALGKPPPHVTILDATTDISTFSLFEIGDVCVTVRGTVGIEAACYGLTTVTAGTGRYDGLGFTIDPQTPEAFRDVLRRVDRLEKPSPPAIELARRYAHAFLLDRPVSYETIQFAYAHDAVASLVISVDEKAGPLLNSPELRAMADFIRSGQEDFLAAR
jgi:hypothetical protein